MTVADLITKLQALPQDAIVVVMDYRGNLDEATYADFRPAEPYWPTHRHNVPPLTADVVEIA